jgi:hypothetical protein
MKRLRCQYDWGHFRESGIQLIRDRLVGDTAGPMGYNRDHVGLRLVDARPRDAGSLDFGANGRPVGNIRCRASAASDVDCALGHRHFFRVRLARQDVADP